MPRQVQPSGHCSHCWAGCPGSDRKVRHTSKHAEWDDRGCPACAEAARLAATFESFVSALQKSALIGERRGDFEDAERCREHAEAYRVAGEYFREHFWGLTAPSEADGTSGAETRPANETTGGNPMLDVGVSTP